jgi:cell wall-associated NlpC family hydrolase
LYACPPDCREISPQEGLAYAHEAVKLAHEYSAAGTPYVYGGGGAQGSDCIHFCHDAATNASLNLPLLASEDFAGNAHYTPVPVSEARAGDVLWQPRNAAGKGHVGVYLGFKDKAGGLVGAEMGGSGASWKSVWGIPQSKGGWFKGGDKLVVYRPLVDKE